MTIMWYLYAIVGADDVYAIGPQSGIDNWPVHTWVAGDLAAIAGPVDAAGFDKASKLADLSENGWLAKAVRAHDQVIWRAFTRVAVLPFRFGVLFAGQDALTGWLHRKGWRLRRALDAVRGAAEWDVQVHTAADTDGNEVPDWPSGTAWVLGRQRDSMVYQTVHDALAAHAVRAHNGFYLVRRDDESAFTRKVCELVELFPGTQIKITGPQPAYHFLNAGGSGPAPGSWHDQRIRARPGPRRAA